MRFLVMAIAIAITIIAMIAIYLGVMHPQYVVGDCIN